MTVVTLGVRLLGSMLLGKGILRTGEGVNRAMQDFQWCLIVEFILKYKNTIRMNLDLRVFNQEMF